MANAKRASMREGPLAALFRKTEDAEDEPPEPAEARAAAGRSAAAPPPRRRAARPARERPAAPRAERLDAGAGRSPRTSHAAGAPAPRLLLGDPRERDGPAQPTRAGDGRLLARAPPTRSERAGPAGQPVIRVVGVGGAGVNAVNRMVEAEVEGVEFLAVNTDLQSLQQSTADITLHIGAELTRGLGSGSDANVGRQAAMEDYDRIKALLKGSDMIFITAGAGGGTGTGAAPIVARISREVGALTVAIVTKPFGFEGSRRSEQAEHGVERAGRGGRHADRRAEQPPAVGARQADRDGRGLPRRRRRAAPGRAGHLRPRHAARPDQPRLRRRAHDHERGRQRAARHRHGRRARTARPRPRCRPSPRRCWKPRWRARARSCCRSPAARTSRCGRSTRPPRPSPRPRTPTPTSSSARWSTRSSTTRCGSRSWPPATATRAGARASACSTSRPASRRCSAPARPPRPARRGGLSVDELDVPEFMPSR